MEAEQQIPPDPKTEEEMIALLRSYKEAREELEILEARGKKLIEQVKAEVDEDLASLKERVERIRESVRVYIHEYNGGKKFRVPGVGTATTSKRRQIKVVDERQLLRYLSDEHPDFVDSIFPRKLFASAAKEIAKTELQEYGSMLPGMDFEETESVVITLK